MPVAVIAVARRSIALMGRRSDIRTRKVRLARPGPAPTARPPTKRVTVSHPTLGGLTEKVERVVDTLDALLRAGPRHLDQRQWQAGQIFRRAYEALSSSIGGVMDLDRVRGAGIPGSPPSAHQLHGAERIAEARKKLCDAEKKLYEVDYRIVTMVAGEGMSLERAAGNIYDCEPTKDMRTKIGDRLRIGLTELAERWVPEAKTTPMRTWRPREAIPQSSMDAARGGQVLVTPHRVAHASGRGVKISGTG